MLGGPKKRIMLFILPMSAKRSDVLKGTAAWHERKRGMNLDIGSWATFPLGCFSASLILSVKSGSLMAALKAFMRPGSA